MTETDLREQLVRVTAERDMLRREISLVLENTRAQRTACSQCGTFGAWLRDREKPLCNACYYNALVSNSFDGDCGWCYRPLVTSGYVVTIHEVGTYCSKDCLDSGVHLYKTGESRATCASCGKHVLTPKDAYIAQCDNCVSYWSVRRFGDLMRHKLRNRSRTTSSR